MFCLQLDDPTRGLAFRACGPLDMRMSPDIKTTAADVGARLEGNASGLSGNYKRAGCVSSSFGVAMVLSTALELEKVLAQLSVLEMEMLSTVWDTLARALVLVVNVHYKGLCLCAPKASLSVLASASLQHISI